MIHSRAIAAGTGPYPWTYAGSEFSPNNDWSGDNQIHGDGCRCGAADSVTRSTRRSGHDLRSGALVPAGKYGIGVAPERGVHGDTVGRGKKHIEPAHRVGRRP